MMATKNIALIALLFPMVFGACKEKEEKVKVQTVNLQNDGYVTGAAVGFQAGFVTGETAEVTLGPISNTFQVTGVQFLFGGNGTTPISRDVVLKIYKDIGVGTPGAELFSSTFSLAASDDILQQINLSDKNIVVTGGGSIRVAIEMTASGLPSVAVDKDGTIATNKNWVKSGASWATSSSLGVNGDFIIRAVVEENI